MKKLVLLAVILAGCVTTTVTEVVTHSQVFTADDKEADALYAAAMIGMWRIYRSPGATVQYADPDIGLIISEGATSVGLNPNSLGISAGIIVYFRLILEVQQGRVRATVEDVHTASRYGLYGDALVAFRAQIQGMMATLAAAIHEPAW